MLEHYYEHMLHLAHEKHRHERLLEEKNRKLDRLKTRLSSRLDGLIRGQSVKVSGLSRAFLKQAVVVDEEKKKLDLLKAQLHALKSSPLTPRRQTQQNKCAL